MFCIVNEAGFGQAAFYVFAVGLQILTQGIQRCVFVAQLHVYHAEKHKRVLGKFHKDSFWAAKISDFAGKVYLCVI